MAGARDFCLSSSEGGPLAHAQCPYGVRTLVPGRMLNFSLVPKLQSMLGSFLGWVWPVACNDSAAQGSATAWVVLTVFDMAARSLVYMVNPCGGGGGWAAPS